MPAQLLSDRGKAFLSKLMLEVYQLIGVHKTNTTAYHPQTDGLVERFHRTLTDMLSKTVETHGRDWDERLPYVLFAYRASLQESTKESPFFLLYGRDPRLPTETTLSPQPNHQCVELDDYKTELTVGLSDAWELARAQVQKAHHRQKHQHDRLARDPAFRVGDRVFVYMPGLKSGKAHKFTRPFRGPYRIVALFQNGAEVRPTDKPGAETIHVALNRVRRCPCEIPGDEKGQGLSTPPMVPEGSRTPPDDSDARELENESIGISGHQGQGLWSGRL